MTTPTLRFDQTTGDWVAYPVGRGDRPSAFAAPLSVRPTRPHDPHCPFCPGQEKLTPESVDLEPCADGGEWSVRAFANKFPALVPDAPRTRSGSGQLLREMGGRGVHEVVVESPDHARSLASLGSEQVLRLLRVLHRRDQALFNDPSLEVVQIFKNHGQRAGSSLPHPHFQILGAPIVPRQIRTKYTLAAEYYHAQGTSLYVDLLDAERSDGRRTIVENEHFVVLAPFASRVPYETRITPKLPAPTFGMADPATLPALAEALSELCHRMLVALGDPPYNLTINSAPRRHADEPDFVWHVEILPRVAAIAGFEFATGMAINTVLPEASAQRLRDAGT